MIKAFERVGLLALVFSLLSPRSLAHGAEVQVSGKVLELQSHSSADSSGQAAWVSVVGGAACNGSAEYALMLDSRADAALFALLTAAKLADEPVRLALRDDRIVAGRCTVIGARLY